MFYAYSLDGKTLTITQDLNSVENVSCEAFELFEDIPLQDYDAFDLHDDIPEELLAFTLYEKHILHRYEEYEYKYYTYWPR